MDFSESLLKWIKSEEETMPEELANQLFYLKLNENSTIKQQCDAILKSKQLTVDDCKTTLEILNRSIHDTRIAVKTWEEYRRQFSVHMHQDSSMCKKFEAFQYELDQRNIKAESTQTLTQLEWIRFLLIVAMNPDTRMDTTKMKNPNDYICQVSSDQLDILVRILPNEVHDFCVTCASPESLRLLSNAIDRLSQSPQQPLSDNLSQLYSKIEHTQNRTEVIINELNYNFRLCKRFYQSEILLNNSKSMLEFCELLQRLLKLAENQSKNLDKKYVELKEVKNQVASAMIKDTANNELAE